MGKIFAVMIDGKGIIQDLESLPEDAQRAARIALNYAADRARTQSAKAVLNQVNFPARYVAPSGGRLAVPVRATNSDLRAVVSAQTRATSLARFAATSRKPNEIGTTKVMVKPGVARYIRNSMFIKLRQGGEMTDTKFNMGLAVRTRGNRRPSVAYKPVQMRNGMWLLYGPSVSQALLSAKESGIWPDMTDEILNNLAREYQRQLERLNV